MAKTKRSKWGYIIPAVLLVMGGLFLFFKMSSATGGMASDGYKAYGFFKGGKITDGLDVHTIRWHKHDGYERLVFDIYKWTGVFGESPFKKSEVTGVYHIGREIEHAKIIDGEVSGFRAFSAKIPNFKGSQRIKGIETFSEDDSSYLFSIELKKEAKYKVFSLKNPARIIIDIK